MIGYYVHHQGRGHLHRALQILAAYGGAATVLSSLSRPTEAAALTQVDWVNLPRDDDGSPSGDPTAGGVLHWAPPHHPGLRGRTATIADWIARASPQLIVVDVSVEVTVLCRLSGVPVVVVAQPGDRRDRPHRFAYDIAEALVACWPREVLIPAWPRDWLAKTSFVGALSRYDGRTAGASAPAAPGRRRVVVLLGAGGRDITDDQLTVAACATPDWDWTVLGGRDWCADPWPLLRDADVVVTHAGQNAVAEVAAARTPAIVLPQRRPHGEQTATAAALSHAGLAVVRDRWPDPAQWSPLLAEAAAADRDRWRQWCPGDGAEKAAAGIRDVACPPR